MLDLSQTVTLVARTTRDHEATKNALELCLSRVKFHSVVICSDDPARVAPDGFEYTAVKVKKLKHAGDGCVWAMTEWPAIMEQINTAEHLLGIEYDGYVTNVDAWDDEFLNWDYTGTPWGDGTNGNGGFTLISREFWRQVGALNIPPRVEECSQSDILLCRYAANGRIGYRQSLEMAGVRYAPPEVAARFSTSEMYTGQFGFHGKPVIPQIERYGLNIAEGTWDASKTVKIITKDTEVPTLTADDNIDALYAKFVLQRFFHVNILGVLRHMAAAVAPGGYLCVSAPDIEFISEQYMSGKMIDNPNIYLFGQQSNPDDCYYSVFNGPTLAIGLTEIGLTDVLYSRGPFGPAHAPSGLFAMGRKPLNAEAA